MNIDGQVHLLGCGQDRVEPLIIKKQPAAGSHDEGSDEAQLVDASPHLVGRRSRVVQRDGGKSPEPGRMLRNLLCKIVIHLATQFDGLWVVQTARTIRAVRHHLDVDADPIHVRQSLPAQPLGRILIRREGLKECAEAGVWNDRRRP